MRIGMITSRRALIEREKAMEAARNPGVSKFGDCLLTSKAKTDKMLVSNIRKINSEIRRMQLQVNQKMKLFVKNSAVLNHDPLILVERPPSPEVVKKAHVMRNYADLDTHFYPEFDEERENRPSYMRQLRSKAKTPSTLTTIDAFTVKSRRKKNVWEGAVDEKEPPTFKSTVRPFAKLTRREISDLQRGYEFHKPKLENSYIPDIPFQSPALPSPPVHRKYDREPKEDADESDNEDMMTFITEMVDAKRNKETRRHSPNITDKHTPNLKHVSKSPGENKLASIDKQLRFRTPTRTSSGSYLSRRKTKTTETLVHY